MSARPRTSNPNWETRLLGIVTAALLVIGIVAVYGASSIVAVQRGQPGSYFAFRHAIGAVVGVIVMLGAARIDYHLWRRWAWVMLGGVCVLLVVLLLPFADGIVLEVNGARRWIGVSGLSFQPAEFAKFAVVVWTAMLAARKEKRIREFKKGLLPFFVILAPVALLILFEPALSNTILVCLAAAIVLFVAGAKIGHILVVGIAAVPLLWQQIAAVQFRLQRMMSFLSPGVDYERSGYQIEQSVTGMGAGQLFGVGFGEGTQKLGFLPYAYSDFVFSTIGEEWGFLGVIFLVILFATFVWLGFRIARTAADPFGRFLAVGLTSLIGVTAFLHMAVTLDLVPTTGLPLPFVSYGRSNLLVSLLAVGVIINIGERRTKPTARAG